MQKRAIFSFNLEWNWNESSIPLKRDTKLTWIDGNCSYTDIWSNTTKPLRGFIITTGAKENILQWIDFSAQYNKEIQNIRWIDPIPIFGAHITKPFGQANFIITPGAIENTL